MENRIQIALLFKALAEGKRLYKLYMDGKEREYFFIEYYKGTAAYRCWGWASALGQPIDRMRAVIEAPFEWHVEEE